MKNRKKAHGVLLVYNYTQGFIYIYIGSLAFSIIVHRSWEPISFWGSIWEYQPYSKSLIHSTKLPFPEFGVLGCKCQIISAHVQLWTKMRREWDGSRLSYFPYQVDVSTRPGILHVPDNGQSLLSRLAFYFNMLIIITKRECPVCW